MLLKTALGLGWVPNTSALDLPVSTATSDAIAAAVAGVLGGAGTTSNTLKKIADFAATRVGPDDLTAALANRATTTQVNSAISTALASLTAGSPAELDTFVEVYNKFLSNDTIVASLNTTISGKASKSANLSDLTDSTAARTNLGLGTAATYAADGLPVSTAQSAAITSATTALVGGAPASANTLKKLSDLVGQRAAIGHTAVPDANYTALATDVHVGFAVLSAPRTVTLPDVESFPFGQTLFIADESGSCSDTRRITITVGTGTGDKIGNQDSIDIGDPYRGVTLRRGAANVWIQSR